MAAELSRSDEGGAGVEEYLRRQGRFAHLFEPRRDAGTLGEIQAAVDAYGAAVEEE